MTAADVVGFCPANGLGDYTVKTTMTLLNNGGSDRYDMRLGLAQDGQILQSNCVTQLLDPVKFPDFSDLDGQGDCFDLVGLGKLSTEIQTEFVFRCSAPTGDVSLALGYSPKAGNFVDGLSKITTKADEKCRIETDTFTVPFPEPDIMIVKTGTLNDTDASGTDTAGDKISYTLTVTNEGTVTLNTVVVTDPDADASPARVADTNGNGDAFLEIGETWNYTAVHTLTQAEIDAGTFTNTADVDAVDPETTPVNDDDTDTQTFTQGGDIDLVEVGTFQDDDGDGFAQPGEEVIFTYTVTNTGNVTLTGVTVNEKAPIDGGLTGNTVTGGPIGSLAPDDDDTTTFTATYVLTQADIDAGEVISVGIATGTLPDGNTTVQDDSSAPAVVIIPRNPDFEIAVDVDFDLIKATLLTDLDTGDFIEVVEQSAVELVYSIEVPNTGNVSLFDLHCYAEYIDWHCDDPANFWPNLSIRR